jgi:hypothetical protein
MTEQDGPPKAAEAAGVRRLVNRVERRLSGGLELHRKIDHLTRLVEKVAAAQKQDEKWRMIFRRQLNAVIRHLYLDDGPEIAAPLALAGRRFRLRSQNEEDGIVLALLKAAGVATRRFVEIGCGSTGGNAAILAHDFGWGGLMIDASRKAVDRLRHELRMNAGVTVVRAFVSPETINDLLREHGAAGEVDLFSIDVDSIDYWLLDALEACTPRVLVLEYNALFGPDRAVTLPRSGVPASAPKGYSGASLAALTSAARRKGYRLVLCEEAGVNAFFLRNDLAPGIPGVQPAQAWRPLSDRWTVDDQPREIDVYAAIASSGLPLVEV